MQRYVILYWQKHLKEPLLMQPSFIPHSEGWRVYYCFTLVHPTFSQTSNCKFCTLLHNVECIFRSILHLLPVHRELKISHIQQSNTILFVTQFSATIHHRLLIFCMQLYIGMVYFEIHFHIHLTSTSCLQRTQNFSNALVICNIFHFRARVSLVSIGSQIPF